MLDGASRVSEVVATAAADGQPAIGITDHGNMYGVLPMYAAAREAGMTAILGEEAYFTTGDRRDKPRRADADIFHLTLLAENEVGYHNLIKVSSGVPRRVPLQAQGRLRSARALRRRPDRDDRLSRQRGLSEPAE